MLHCQNIDPEPTGVFFLPPMPSLFCVAPPLPTRSTHRPRPDRHTPATTFYSSKQIPTLSSFDRYFLLQFKKMLWKPVRIIQEQNSSASAFFFNNTKYREPLEFEYSYYIVIVGILYFTLTNLIFSLKCKYYLFSLKEFEFLLKKLEAKSLGTSLWH